MLRDRRYNETKLVKMKPLHSKKLYAIYAESQSESRMKKYLACSKGNVQLAIARYRLNITLSALLFGELAYFEITLRNRIHTFYCNQYQDAHWIRIFTVEKGKRKVEDFSLGFWVSLFAPIQFRKGKQSLHKIYTQRPKGTAPKMIYRDLLFTQRIRNRIAHHEPICFNKDNEFDLQIIYQFEDIIWRHSSWLGFQPEDLHTKLPNFTNE